MSIKFYQLYCEICNWKNITSGAEVEEKLQEYKISPIPGGAPYLDKEKNKIIKKPITNRIRKFKCPNCGRLVTPRQIKNPQEEIDLKNEVKERKSHEQDWSDGRKESDARSEIQRVPPPRTD